MLTSAYPSSHYRFWNNKKSSSTSTYSSEIALIQADRSSVSEQRDLTDQAPLLQDPPESHGQVDGRTAHLNDNRSSSSTDCDDHLEGLSSAAPSTLL
jgi:hypothetical protein